MKKLIVLASLFFAALHVDAQVDTATVEVSLKARHHAWIVSLMSDKGSVERVRYSTQVASALSLPVDTAQVITVRVSTSLIKELYLTIGSQQERLATNYNNEIKQALIPQIMHIPDLISSLLQIGEQNSRETNYIVNTGLDYLKAIKK